MCLCVSKALSMGRFRLDLSSAALAMRTSPSESRRDSRAMPWACSFIDLSDAAQNCQAASRAGAGACMLSHPSADMLHFGFE